MLSSNHKVLKKNYPEVLRALESLESSEINYLIETNGYSNLVFNSTFVHSKYNPIVEANRFLDGITLDEGMDSILVIGLGLGYYINGLKAKYPDKKLIIIEPSLEIFLACVSILDISEMIKSDNVAFIVGKDANAVKQIYEHYHVEGKVKRTYYAVMPIYMKLYGQYTNQIFELIKRSFELLQANVATERYFVDKWLYNVLSNVEYLTDHHTIGVIGNSFINRPAVIVSAGPSLEKQFDLLKKHRDNLLIIAVGTAASILDANGIRPHVIMGLDGLESEANIFRSLNDHTPLFMYAHMIHKDAIRVYNGPKMWFIPNGDYRINELCKRLNIVPTELYSGGSIAHTALALCDSLECDPIMLIGQDLAYTNDKLYAVGAIHDSDSIDKKQYILMKDIYGKDIYTKAAFIDFRNWFEDFIKIKMPTKKVYNCTEGGINIEGAENKTFNEMIESYCGDSFDSDAIIAEILDKKLNYSKSAYNKKMKKLSLDLIKLHEVSEVRITELANLINSGVLDGQGYTVRFNYILELTKKLERNEFYKIFIKNTGLFYHQAMNRAIHQEAEGVIETQQKKRVLLEGLLKTYVQIHSYILVSLEALNIEL